MKYIGPIGEWLVMTELLKRDIEAYLAILENQKDYDITVVTKNSNILRLQVKTTELQNKSTNNTIKIQGANYNFLILVVILSNGETDFYIIPKAKVGQIMGKSKQLSLSKKSGNKYIIKEEFSKYKMKWNLIDTTEDI